MDRERIYLIGGPADGKILDVPTDRTPDQRQGHARTDWLHDGHVVYRYRNT